MYMCPGGEPHSPLFTGSVVKVGLQLYKGGLVKCTDYCVTLNWLLVLRESVGLFPLNGYSLKLLPVYFRLMCCHVGLFDLLYVFIIGWFVKCAY